MNVANVIPLSASYAAPYAKRGHPVALNPVRVRFDAFELDEPNALLLRNGRAVTLAPRPFGVLCALARRPGSLLTKHALLDDVWGHQFVTDSVLKTAVSEVRTVLDDHPRQPRFIETVCRRGYRFIAPTTAISAAASVPRIHFPGRPSDALRRERACTDDQPAYATADEVRYADELRLQLRARLLRDAAPRTRPWSVGAD